jgi:hypothetical protein
MQTYKFNFSFVWVWNLISHIKGKITCQYEKNTSQG